MKSPLRILHLEDDPNDAELVQAKLAAEGFACEVVRVETRVAYLAALDQGGFDLILTDYSLPSFDGLTALKLAQEKCPDVPFILVSGTLGEEPAIETLQQGATDYVLKQKLSRLAPAVARALREARERRERRRAEEQLQHSEELFRAVIQHSSDAIILIGADGTIRYASASAPRVLGNSMEALIGLSVFAGLHPDDAPAAADLFAHVLEAPDASVTGQFRYQHQDGSWRWLEGTATNLLDNPSVQAIVVNYRDITERKQAEQALEITSTQLKTLFDNLDEVFFSLDAVNWKVLQISPACEKVYGLPQQAFLANAQLWRQVIHPEDRSRIEASQPDLLAGIPLHHEYRIVRPDGEMRWVESKVKPSLDAAGQVMRLYGIVSDVTGRRLAEQRLRLQSAAMESAANAIVITDRDGNITWVNPAFTRLTGYAPEEVLGHNPRILKSGQRDQAFYQNLWETILAGQVWRGEMVNRRKDGTLYTEEMTITPVGDESGSIAYFVGIKQDITERKQAEDNLKRTTAELRLLNDLVEQSIQPFSVADLQARLVRFNRAFAQLTGYGDDELRQLSFMQLVPERWHSVVAEIVSQLLTTGQSVRLEVDVQRKDGSVVPVEVAGNIYRNAAGEPEYLYSFVTDITDRKRAEETLRQNEKRFRALIEHTADGIALLDPNGVAVYASPGITGLLGYSLEEYVGRNGLELVHPDDLQDAASTLAQVLQRPNASVVVLTRVRHKDGSWRWLEGIATNLLAEPSVQAIVANFRDVTERRLAEEQFRSVVEASPHAIILVNQAGGIHLVNRRAEALFGYTREELTGRPAETLLPEPFRARHAGDRERFFAARATRPMQAVEDLAGLRKDGSLVPLEIELSPLTTSEGAFVMASIVDITERKRAEQALRRSEERFSTIFQASPIAISLTALPDETFLDVNDSFLRMTGYSREDVIGHTSQALHLWADRDERARIAQALGEQRSVHNLEIRFRKQSGEMIEALVSAVRIDLADQACILTLAHDVTERKRAEAQVRKLSRAVEQSPNIVMITDTRGNIEYVNPKFTQVTGHTPEEIIGTNSLDLGESDPAQAELMASALEASGEWRGEFPNIKKNGERYWEAASVSAIRDERGVVTHYLKVAEDATEHKRAEEALRLSSEVLQRVNALILVADAEGRVTYASPSCQTILGYAPDELLGDRWWTLSRPDPVERERERTYVVRAARGETPVSEAPYERLVRRRDGEVRWIAWQDAKGPSHLLIGVGHDITERKRAEEVLRYRLDMDRLIATISTSFIYLAPDEIDAGISRALEAVGTSVDVDRSYVFRFSDDGQLVDNTHEWCAEGIAPRLDRLKAISIETAAWWLEQLNRFEPIHVGRVADLPAAAGTQVERLRGSGVQSVLIVPMVFGKALVGFLGFDSVRAEKTWSEEDIRLLKLMGEIFVNALVRRQAQAALEQERALLAQRVAERTADLSAANAALARAVRLKDEFLASMSHELRTPLNAILGLSEALQEQVYGPLNDDQLKALHTVEESGRHLLDLINDVLDLSKIEAGKLELQIDTVSVESICQAGLRLIREAANKKRLKVHSTLDSAVATLQADERRLMQILVNLLSNAVKFTPDGGSIGLEVAGDEEHGVVRFTVWDTGIGITPEDMSRLFQPFVQLDSRLARQHSGTGLGLSLVYRMVEMHGGSIQVESDGVPGTGSRFTVSLPAQLPAGEALSASETPDVRPTATIRRVLIVEDSPTVAGQLARYLAELGAETALHAGDEGVVDKVLQIQPDVILLDILLPNPTGWDVLARLKAEPRTRDIPVVVVSVVDDPEMGLALGAAGYLVKPVSRQQLRSALSRLRPEVERTAPAAPAATLERAAREQPLILLAEDNENNIHTLSDYLLAKDYRLVVARNGGEAIERAMEEKPDLILMDVQMPGMDGLEATRRIRADAGLHDIPIIALTALAMPGDRERCLQAGASEYLSKPVSLKQLAETIQAQLRPYSTRFAHERTL